MSFWRNEVIDPILDAQTKREIDEQMVWIAREPENPDPYVHLASLYRTQNRSDEALGLLLEAIRLNPTHAEANIALCEMYSVSGDYPAAWRHARRAQAAGDATGVELLTRHAITE
ncbi:MAG: tetratricopeptide repeat protein [Hyphomicrobium sp.]